MEHRILNRHGGDYRPEHVIGIRLSRPTISAADYADGPHVYELSLSVTSVNRQLGVATYAPRLDVHGHSIRGIRAFTDLAARLGLHAFDIMNSGSNFLETVL